MWPLSSLPRRAAQFNRLGRWCGRAAVDSNAQLYKPLFRTYKLTKQTHPTNQRESKPKDSKTMAEPTSLYKKLQRLAGCCEHRLISKEQQGLDDNDADAILASYQHHVAVVPVRRSEYDDEPE